MGTCPAALGVFSGCVGLLLVLLASLTSGHTASAVPLPACGDHSGLRVHGTPSCRNRRGGQRASASPAPETLPEGTAPSSQLAPHRPSGSRAWFLVSGGLAAGFGAPGNPRAAPRDLGRASPHTEPARASERSGHGGQHRAPWEKAAGLLGRAHNGVHASPQLPPDPSVTLRLSKHTLASRLWRDRMWRLEVPPRWVIVGKRVTFCGRGERKGWADPQLPKGQNSVVHSRFRSPLKEADDQV